MHGVFHILNKKIAKGMGGVTMSVQKTSKSLKKKWEVLRFSKKMKQKCGTVAGSQKRLVTLRGFLTHRTRIQWYTREAFLEKSNGPMRNQRFFVKNKLRQQKGPHWQLKRSSRRNASF